MKQKFLSLLLGASLVGTLCAAPRTQQQAKAIAQQMAASKGHTLVAQAHNPMPGSKALQPYYVFDVEQGGFVIISGEEKLPALVGYSDQGSFDTDHLPAALEGYLEQYAAAVTRVSSSDTYYGEQGADEGLEYPIVAPLLGQTIWAQDAPYNNLCPEVEYEKVVEGQPQLQREHTLTGCTATAAAQIMYYYRYPQLQAAIPAYTTGKYDIEMPAVEANGEAYDWDHMLPYYGESETPEQQDAVAKLMLHVGCSMQMNYCLAKDGGSMAGEQEVLHGFELMGYDTSLLQLHYRYLFTRRHWLEVINSELEHQRPIEYMGKSSLGGHAFVIDGCDGQGYYHVNWGWRGKSNGYFDIAVLDPNHPREMGRGSRTDGYNGSNSMIIGITPLNAESEGQQQGDVQYWPDAEQIELTVTDAEGGNNLWYSPLYDFYNPLLVDVSNHSEYELYYHFMIGFRDRETQYLEMKWLDVDLGAYDTQHIDMDLKTPREPLNMEMMWNFAHYYSEPSMLTMTEVEAPQLNFCIESNAAYRQGDTIDVICGQEAKVHLTVTNTGGRYRGRDFAIAFYKNSLKIGLFEFPEGVTELDFSLPVEPGDEGAFAVYRRNASLEATTNYPGQDNWIGNYHFVVTDDITGIEQLAPTERPAQTGFRYNLQGQPVSADYRGLFIQR